MRDVIPSKPGFRAAIPAAVDVAAPAPPYALTVGFTKSQAEEEASHGYGSSDKSVRPEHVDDAVLRELTLENTTESSCSYFNRSRANHAAVITTGKFMRHAPAGRSQPRARLHLSLNFIGGQLNSM